MERLGHDVRNNGEVGEQLFIRGAGCDKDDLWRRVATDPTGLQPCEERMTIENGHSEIKKKKRWVEQCSGGLFHPGDRFPAVGCFNGLEPVGVEHVSHHRAYGRVIIHD